MRALVAATVLLLGISPAGAADAPQALLTLGIYGGTVDEIAALLEPVLARHEFQRKRVKSAGSGRGTAAEFSSPTRETITISGGVYCVILNYYPVAVVPNGADGGARQRSLELRQEIREYFRSLPTPRPTLDDDRSARSGGCRGAL